MNSKQQDELSFADRLRWIMDRYQLIIKDASEQCGIPASTFNRYLANTVPTLDNLEKIIKAFPDISIDWLVTGHGQPFKEPESAIIESKYAAALEKIHLLEENISLYKKLMDKTPTSKS